MKRIIRSWLGIDSVDAKANNLHNRVAQLEFALKQANERAEVLACELEAMDWRVPRGQYDRVGEVRVKLDAAGFSLMPF